MDALIKVILKYIDKIPSPWNIVLAVFILLIFFSPRLGSLRGAWVDLRRGRRELEIKRQQLELQKIRYEIEAIKKTHGLPELEPSWINIHPKASKEQPKPRSVVWKWLLKHPIMGEISLVILQIIVGFYLFAFALGAIGFPFITRLEKGEPPDIGSMILGWVFCIVLAYLLYKAYKAILKRKKELRLEVANKEHQEDMGDTS